MRASRQQQRKAYDMRPHVMISYQWKSQELMKKVVSILKYEGYKVWIDIENMEGNLNDGMVEAIENAEVVLVAMSKKYEQSINCRKEAEYAETKGKPMIPLLVEKGYRADNWLDLVVGKMQYYDLTKEDRFDNKMAEVIKAIEVVTNISGSNGSSNEPGPVKLDESDDGNDDDLIDLLHLLDYHLVIERKPTVSKKPHLSTTKWHHFTEKIKPVLVESVRIWRVNLGLCHSDVFNYIKRCENAKKLLLYGVSDDTDDDTDIVTSIISALPSLKKLRWLDIWDIYLGEMAKDLFDSLPTVNEIRILTLHDTNQSDSGTSLINLLSRLPLLSYLDLFYCDMSITELAPLLHCLPSSCPNLLCLEITGVKFTFVQIKPVFELGKLKSLGLTAADSTDDLREILKNVPPHIELLYVTHQASSEELNDLISVINPNTNLQILMLRGKNHLNSEDEKSIKKKLSKKGVRFVGDTDPQGFDDYKMHMENLKFECLDAK